MFSKKKRRRRRIHVPKSFSQSDPGALLTFATWNLIFLDWNPSSVDGLACCPFVQRCSRLLSCSARLAKNLLAWCSENQCRGSPSPLHCYQSHRRLVHRSPPRGKHAYCSIASDAAQQNSHHFLVLHSRLPSFGHPVSSTFMPHLMCQCFKPAAAELLFALGFRRLQWNPIARLCLTHCGDGRPCRMSGLACCTISSLQDSSSHSHTLRMFVFPLMR